MKNTAQTLTPTEAAERFALRVTARLSDGTGELPYEIAERLRAARMQALAQRRLAAPVRCRTAAATVARAGHTAWIRGNAGGGGDEGGGWWNALVSAVPLLVLVVGLVLISIAQDERSANDMAEVDAALLTDDLPPAAYADPGFVQFLKTSAAAASP